jgi:hypothetical protein
MSIQNTFNQWQMKAEEDLSNTVAGTGHIHKAVSIQTGKITSTALDVIGLVQRAARQNAHVGVGVDGIQKFVAAAAVSSAGIHLTVTTSGYLTTVGSGDYVVGKTLASVASGAVGYGLFNFAVPFQSPG